MNEGEPGPDPRLWRSPHSSRRGALCWPGLEILGGNGIYYRVSWWKSPGGAGIPCLGMQSSGPFVPQGRHSRSPGWKSRENRAAHDSASPAGTAFP